MKVKLSTTDDGLTILAIDFESALELMAGRCVRENHECPTQMSMLIQIAAHNHLFRLATESGQ